MTFNEMVKAAVEAGKGEEAMWKSVDYFSEYIETLKETDPKKYWDIMRGTSESINGNHYTEMFARLDVGAMHSTDENGVEHNGEYWTCEDIVEAISGKKFPEGTTKWDVYVACNAFWHDLNKVLTDEKILEASYAFFFFDEDWHGEGKIWTYMKMKY